MNTQTPIGKFERAGSWLGRLWRALRKGEGSLIAWLVAGGCPASVARGLMWVVRLAFVGVLLYTSITAAAALIVLLVIARTLARSNLSAPYKAAEWRSGPLGFGLYDQSGWRIDPHDPNDLFREP